MPKRKGGMHIGPRELFLMMESLALAMDVFKGDGGYEALERDPGRLRRHNEAHELFLKLEEQWDSMSEKDRNAGAYLPFNVRQFR